MQGTIESPALAVEQVEEVFCRPFRQSMRAASFHDSRPVPVSRRLASLLSRSKAQHRLHDPRTFATPYAIFIFQQYSASIPFELDEAARIDGASPPQIFFRIYLPLMAPALVAIGTYALLLSWNEYLYAFLLLSGGKVITVPVTLGKFLVGDEAPWNYLMAAAIIYAIPPLLIYYGVRRKMHGGLTMGGVKG